MTFLWFLIKKKLIFFIKRSQSNISTFNDLSSAFPVYLQLGQFPGHSYSSWKYSHWRRQGRRGGRPGRACSLSCCPLFFKSVYSVLRSNWFLLTFLHCPCLFHLYGPNVFKIQFHFRLFLISDKDEVEPEANIPSGEGLWEERGLPEAPPRYITARTLQEELCGQ